MSFFSFVHLIYIHIVTGLNVGEFNQVYEIRGRLLSDPIACEKHGTSQQRHTSRVVCVGLLILIPNTVPNVSVYRPDSLCQEQLIV